MTKALRWMVALTAAGLLLGRVSSAKPDCDSYCRNEAKECTTVCKKNAGKQGAVCPKVCTKLEKDCLKDCKNK